MSRTWNVVLWLLGCAMAVTAVVVEMAATVTTRGIEEDSRDGSFTVKTIATEIQSPKLTEFKSVYVAFQVGARFQQPALTEISGSIQSGFTEF